MSLETAAPSAKNAPSYLKTVLLGESFLQYWRLYAGSRRFPKDQKFYVVYTNLDHSIPFEPDSTREYWLVNLKFIPTFARLGGVTSRRTFDEIRAAYVDLAREGGAAFKAVPTIMPRWGRRGGGALRAAHGLLRPINCSPSLHTAAPLFAYNVGAHFFAASEPKLRQYVGDIVSTVIRSKLHALIDVAFGILAARKGTERLGLEFNDLESFFTHDQHDKDGVPYDQVYRMYHEISDLERTIEGGADRLPRVMQGYFTKIGLPRVTSGQAGCLFDLEKGVVVGSSELRAGGGLF
jgi:hypothetical protein